VSENDASTGPQLEPWFSEAPTPRTPRKPRRQADNETNTAAETVPIESLFEADATGPVQTQHRTEHETEPLLLAPIDERPPHEATQQPSGARAGLRRLRRTPNLLAILGGARADAISGAPGDRQAYSAMALILMFTATVAALSMAFALGMVFHADWYWFIPVGLFWGAGIFAIDRALTIQLSNTKGAWRTAFAVVPRILLAGILGAVISTPVTLQIFAPEISAHILVM
jgi:hypothetical protein